MQQWYNWLHEKNKKGIQSSASFRRMISSVDGSRLLAQNQETRGVERRVCKFVEELKEDAKPVRGCEEKRKE